MDVGNLLFYHFAISVSGCVVKPRGWRNSSGRFDWCKCLQCDNPCDHHCCCTQDSSNLSFLDSLSTLQQRVLAENLGDIRRLEKKRVEPYTGPLLDLNDVFVGLPAVLVRSPAPQESYPFFLRTLPPDSGQASAMWHWILEFQVPSATCVYLGSIFGKDFFFKKIH